MAIWDYFKSRKTSQAEAVSGENHSVQERFIGLLNEAKYEELSDLAKSEIGRSNDSVAWIMQAHALIRRGFVIEVESGSIVILLFRITDSRSLTTPARTVG